MEHSVLYWDEMRYSSFPILVKGENDALWIAFNWNSHTPLARGIEGAVYSHAGGLAGGGEVQAVGRVAHIIAGHQVLRLL